MTHEAGALDSQRTRWRQAREQLRLVETDQQEFASRGLVRRVDEPSVRLLILPEDPEGWLVDFNDDFWHWWRGDHPDPSAGQPARWGAYFQATSDAAVRSSLILPNMPWRDYLALHRSGALEVELGRYGAADAKIERAAGGVMRVFRLITIIGRAWATLALYGKVRSRFAISGTTEFSVALQKTAGAFLGNLAQGWAEPWDYNHEGQPQVEENLLLRREIASWESLEVAHLAQSVGNWLEDCWGSTVHRYLVPRGPAAGQFDSAEIRWPQ